LSKIGAGWNGRLAVVLDPSSAESLLIRPD
jgi:hypothetical protein